MADKKLNFRNAIEDDVVEIVHMLSDDPLGAKRERFETPLPKAYFKAFLSISEDQWAIKRAKDRNCHLIQLTTDKQRPDTIQFYESLGFAASHLGMKLHFE